MKIGNWVFTSRCHGNNQATGKIVEGGLEAQARQTFANLATLMKSAGGSQDNVTQITTFGREADYMPVAKRCSSSTGQTRRSGRSSTNSSTSSRPAWLSRLR